MRKKLFFVITQFYKGGAEMALLNLFKNLSPDEYEVDLLIHDQAYLPGYTCLINSLPSWVRVCNASQGEKWFIAENFFLDAKLDDIMMYYVGGAAK